MGGHNIPEDIILRRYSNGIHNLTNLYCSICDFWMIIYNSFPPFSVIAEGNGNVDIDIKNCELYNKIINYDWARN